MSAPTLNVDASSDTRPHCLVALFALDGIAFPEPVWLWETVAWLAGLTLLWILTEATLHGLRRVRWMSHASSAKLARVARVGFGGGLMAALFLPYLADVAPTSALIVVLAIAALTLPFIGGAAGVHGAGAS